MPSNKKFTPSSPPSGKQIIKAGELLIEKDLQSRSLECYENAMNTLSFWRSAHEQPLNEAYLLLHECIGRVEKGAATAKRLKRTDSIINKLLRYKGMKLKNMYDIGGCRAILSNDKKLNKLIRELKKKKDFKIKTRSTDDGYRGIHLIGKFNNHDGSEKFIEIQLRTKMQHSWATAVEIIDLFTKQNLKSGSGEKEWSIFFKLVSDQFQYINDLPLSNVKSEHELTETLTFALKYGYSNWDIEHLRNTCEKTYLLCHKLGVIQKFSAYAGSLKVIDEELTEAPLNDGYILLDVDLEYSNIKCSLFQSHDFSEAAKQFLEAEKNSGPNPNRVVALISTDAVGGIKEAYPNYFADSEIFIRNLNISRNAYRNYNRNGLLRAVKKALYSSRV